MSILEPPESSLNLTSSSATKSKSKSKPRPNPKKKPTPTSAPKEISASAELDNELLDLHASAPGGPAPQTLVASNSTKRKSPLPHQLDDDVFGSWNTPIPGGPTPTSTTGTNAKRRKKIILRDSDDEATPTGHPIPPHVPNTITQPPVSPSGPSYVRASSSPLSSPGRSPQTKRKSAPQSTLDQDSAPGPAKKPRKSGGGVLEVVLPGPAGRGEGEKKKAKGKTARGKNKTLPIGTGVDEDGNAYVPPVLSPVVDTSSSGLKSDSSKAKTAPATSSGGSSIVPKPTSADGGSSLDQSAMDAPAEVDPALVEPLPAAKKQPKKRAPKAKKAAAAADDVATAEGGETTPAAGKKKGAKSKGKAKAKEDEPIPEVCLFLTVTC